MGSDTGKQPGEERRNFLRLLLTLGAVAATGAVASMLRLFSFVPPPSLDSVAQKAAWPKVKVANLSDLKELSPVRFNYPLVDTPNILVKLGVKAENGVGPDQDIVAYSGVCQHLGCFYSFVPQGSAPPCNPTHGVSAPEGYCCCHGGEYDFAKGARVLAGPPPRPVPFVRLDYDRGTGDIYAVEMGPPTIFGHGPPGTTDPALLLKYDLEGGEIVTRETVLSH